MFIIWLALAAHEALPSSLGQGIYIVQIFAHQSAEARGVILPFILVLILAAHRNGVVRRTHSDGSGRSAGGAVILGLALAFPFGGLSLSLSLAIRLVLALTHRIGAAGRAQREESGSMQRTKEGT
jgi:hypothetical protein